MEQHAKVMEQWKKELDERGGWTAGALQDEINAKYQPLCDELFAKSFESKQG